MPVSYVAGNPICNATVSEANQFINLLATQGVDGGELFACPIGQVGTALELVPYAGFGKEGVPTLTPAYLMVKFTGSTKYPSCYTVGMCLFMMGQGVPAIQTLV